MFSSGSQLLCLENQRARHHHTSDQNRTRGSRGPAQGRGTAAGWQSSEAQILRALKPVPQLQTHREAATSSPQLKQATRGLAQSGARRKTNPNKTQSCRGNPPNSGPEPEREGKAGPERWEWGSGGARGVDAAQSSEQCGWRPSERGTRAGVEGGAQRKGREGPGKEGLPSSSARSPFRGR